MTDKSLVLALIEMIDGLEQRLAELERSAMRMGGASDAEYERRQAKRAERFACAQRVHQLAADAEQRGIAGAARLVEITSATLERARI